MIREKLVRDGLMYHSAHGLCRIDRIMKESREGKEVLCYALVPKTYSRMKVRFVIADADIEASGFHPLISPAEANKILDYLKAGDMAADFKDITPEAGLAFELSSHPWGLAKGILTFSRHTPEIKDQKKRQTLERFARGLVEEFAIVFKTTTKESSTQILRSLGNRAKINPLVLVALGGVV